MYHLPEWMSAKAVAEWESDKDAVRKTAEAHLNIREATGEWVKGRYEVTRHHFVSGIPDASWCWRHLTRCQKIEIGWSMEYREEVEDVHGVEAGARVRSRAPR